MPKLFSLILVLVFGMEKSTSSSEPAIGFVLQDMSPYRARIMWLIFGEVSFDEQKKNLEKKQFLMLNVLGEDDTYGRENKEIKPYQNNYNKRIYARTHEYKYANVARERIFLDANINASKLLCGCESVIASCSGGLPSSTAELIYNQKVVYLSCIFGCQLVQKVICYRRWTWLLFLSTFSPLPPANLWVLVPLKKSTKLYSVCVCVFLFHYSNTLCSH